MVHDLCDPGVWPTCWSLWLCLLLLVFQQLTELGPGGDQRFPLFTDGQTNVAIASAHSLLSLPCLHCMTYMSSYQNRWQSIGAPSLVVHFFKACVLGHSFISTIWKVHFIALVPNWSSLRVQALPHTSSHSPLIDQYITSPRECVSNHHVFLSVESTLGLPCMLDTKWTTAAPSK